MSTSNPHLVDGARVSWVTSKGVRGTGLVVSYPDIRGHVYVAVDAEPGEPHPMIYCALTWLNEEPS